MLEKWVVHIVDMYVCTYKGTCAQQSVYTVCRMTFQCFNGVYVTINFIVTHNLSTVHVYISRAMQ